MQTPRTSLRTRLHYWFDNTMTRGTSALIGWLAIASALLVAGIAAGLALAHAGGIFDLMWQSFSDAFELSIPDQGNAGIHVLWFVLGIGGLFLISALIGLLNNGISEKLDDLRKGRSLVVEHDHTVILGWSDQVFIVVSELVVANRSRKKAAIVILAEQDKLVMDDLLRLRIGDTGNTRIVCRTGNPLDVKDLELVNLNGARSIVVLTPHTPVREDADAYVLKTLLAINRGPAFRDAAHHVVTSVQDGASRAVAQLAGGTAVVIDADDISARLIVQAARQSGLSAVYHDLMDFGGDELYVVAEHTLHGTDIRRGSPRVRAVLPGRADVSPTARRR